MFWITVGHARRHTARAMGPSTIERSNDFALLVDGGWMERFYNSAIIRSVMKPAAAMDLNARAATLGDALRDEPAIVFAYLFGSRADGTAGPRSDVDVAVYLVDGVDAFNMRLTLMGRLAACLRTDALDVIVLNDAPLALTGRIVESRRVVLDRAPGVRQAFESLTARMFNDFRIRERRLLSARYPGG
jgi:hypothetical protein